MDLSAEIIFEAVASKIENQCRLPAENLKSLKSRAKKLAKNSKYFSILEVDCLIRQFYVLLGCESNLAKPIRGMNKREFMYILDTIFGIDSKVMIDRLFANLDLNKDGYIAVDEWVDSLGIFLRGDLDDKSKLTFQVYDLNSDFCISKEEMFYMLKKGETKKTKDDKDLEDLLDMTFKMVDYDHDELLSYSDFQKSVQKDVLFLQAFGKCLPDMTAITVFENHLAELKRIIKAKGIQELAIPRARCLLNMSTGCPSHKLLTCSTEKITGFLPSALSLAYLPPMSPKGIAKSQRAAKMLHFTTPVTSSWKSTNMATKPTFNTKTRSTGGRTSRPGRNI